jgi:hypothetical protein
MMLKSLLHYLKGLQVKMNNRYEVLTEDGFKSFKTVSSKIVDEYIKIEFTDGTLFGCTHNHLIKLKNNDYIFADDVKPGLMTSTDKEISSVEIINGPITVYDLVDVEGGNNYLTNNITSHNCIFISSEHTLFDSYYVSQSEQAEVRKVEQLTKNDRNKHDVDYVPSYPYNVAGHKFWKRLSKDKTYLVGVDPATGSGEDYTVFEVFEFPGLEQVLEYRSNTISSPIAYIQLKNLLLFLENFSNDVYFSIESNGVGAGMISLYEADESPPIYSHFVTESGSKKLGMFTTAPTKIRAALRFKELFERNHMTLHSPVLFHEMKNYARKDGAYGAVTGANDDTISAVLIVIRILQEMASYDDNAYAKMYLVDSEIEMKEKWNYDESIKDKMIEKEQEEYTPLPFIIS